MAAGAPRPRGQALNRDLEWDFPAVLQTPDGQVVEYGSACVSLSEGSVDFKSEFVPIFKMGTPLQVVRTQDGVATQLFCGEVYLSAERLLRLVKVRDEVLPGAAEAYAYELQLPGELEAVLPRRRRLPFMRPLPQLQRFAVTVYELSVAQVKFTCPQVFDKGQRLRLSLVGPPAIDRAALEVDMAVTFVKGADASYRCQVLDWGQANRQRLLDYLRALALRTNKAFPPAADSLLHEAGRLEKEAREAQSAKTDFNS